jgi:tetratricopeptide (TPR) repeat protein
VSPAIWLAAFLAAQNVFVPPVPAGIVTDTKVRAPRTMEFPSQKLHWIRVHSAHFDVLSSASARKTEEIVSDLETLAVVLKRTSTRFQTAPVATKIFVLSDADASRAWFELLLGSGNHLSGAYVRHAGGGTMIIDGANTGRIARTAMHELVHDLLRQGELVPPLWLEEGLAEYFSGAHINKYGIVAGSSLFRHMAFLSTEPKLMPLESLLAVRPETPAAAGSLFYAQSWAAVDWLMQLDNNAFYPFLEDLERGVPVERALAQHYGITPGALEGAIRRRPHLTGTTVRFPVEARILAAPPSELERATLLYELGRFLSIIAGEEGEAGRYYQEALRIDPRHARTLAALGRYEEAVAAAPNDAEVYLAYAESLLNTATGPFAGVFEVKVGDPERFRHVRRLSARACELLRDSNTASEARALGDLGTSYLVESDVTDGIAALQRATAMLPQRNDFALNLYALLLRAGDRPKADALFASTFARSRDPQILFAARRVLLAAEVRHANALSNDGKFDEAAALVRGLATATEDVAAKRQLESQAVELENAAAVSRHIRMYNDAVQLVNTNHYDDALRILDAILKEATDPLVIADAKQLRDELRKP